MAVTMVKTMTRQQETPRGPALRAKAGAVVAVEVEVVVAVNAGKGAREVTARMASRLRHFANQAQLCGAEKRKEERQRRGWDKQR